MIALWLTATLLGAAGLRLVAPRRAPLLHLGPAACTTAVLAFATVYVAVIWSS